MYGNPDPFDTNVITWIAAVAISALCQFSTVRHLISEPRYHHGHRKTSIGLHPTPPPPSPQRVVPMRLVLARVNTVELRYITDTFIAYARL